MTKINNEPREGQGSSDRRRPRLLAVAQTALAVIFGQFVNWAVRKLLG